MPAATMKNNILPESIQSISGGTRWKLTADGLLLQGEPGGTITLDFEYGVVFLMRHEAGGWYILPHLESPGLWQGDSLVWVLPSDVTSPGPVWRLHGPVDCPIQVTIKERVHIEARAEWLELTRYENRPHADVFGDRFAFSIQNGATLADAYAAFYWDTLLPCVVERTRAAGYPTPDGYVLSTLAPHAYGGTYPDVDHEFQVKGRLAAGSALDEDISRRMMELQFRMMREDPEGLWRNPCAVQSGGEREYHVRRSSQDGSQNAEMFLLTGNIEILEEAWQYTASVKDRAWLERHIADLEGAASCIEANIDRYGRLWSDVYFEDQVIQDGRVCDAQAFAANGLRLLAELEELLGRGQQAAHCRGISSGLARMLTASLPRGFWDADQRRFTNWVDRSGIPHDHIHLLSNEMPALFGFADREQVQAVGSLMDEHMAEFQRFPSFVAADLAGYTPSEIGVGGPYDLCAAGRYWCWDAAYWAWRGDGERLYSQLIQVAAEAAHDHYRMGERYDMDHVFYIDGSNWHGATDYYEYPCVFNWVLLHDYIGVGFSLEADLALMPRIAGGGRVELNQKRFALTYQVLPDEFSLTNLAEQARSFRVDLSVIYSESKQFYLELGDKNTTFQNGGMVRLQPGEACRFRVIHK